MATIKSTPKILDALQAAGVITGWKKGRNNASWSDTPVWETTFSANIGSRLAVEHEAYGRKVQMYFRCASDEAAEAAIQVLRDLGYTNRQINLHWGGPDRRTFEIPVTYFKASRWWE